METRREKLENIIATYFTKQDYTSKQMLDAIESLFSEEWVSVNDRLPEFGTEVIVFVPSWKDTGDRDRVTALCLYINNRIYWDNNYGGGNTHIQEAVTHWMPLPQPPKQ